METIMKIIKSPITKVIASVMLFLMVAAFSSFTTQQSVRKNMTDYMSFQFKAAVRDVLSEDISPRLSNIEVNVGKIASIQEAQMKEKYEDIVRQVNKNYEKMKKGDTADMTKANFDALGGWWKQLPDSYKTEVLAARYKAIVDFYSAVF